MTKEQEETIDRLNSFKTIKILYGNTFAIHLEQLEQLQKDMATVLDLVKQQQEELERLRNKNKDLLRKLRNRVKEVKKLTKYSLYKKEFKTLNEQIQQKDKIIDEMAKFISNLDIDEDICKKICLFQNCEIEEQEYCQKCIKQYFKKKVSEE